MEQQTVSDLYLSPDARSLLDQVVTQPERQTLPDSLAKSPFGTGENNGNKQIGA
jgi:hypothetical protein